MRYPVKIYVAVQNKETKIVIPVFDIEDRGYSAMMLPLARGDSQLMSHFEKNVKRQEHKKTVELAIEACETWIKERLGPDVAVFETA
jgi:hypothetical protein